MNNKYEFNGTTPLYEQIKEDLKRKIIDNDLKENEQVGSNSELAKLYDVSLITVKKAISSLVNEGVLFTRIGKGTYVASRNSWKLDHSKVRNIGLVIRNLTHPYFSMIIPAIEKQVNELGYNLLLASSSDNLAREESQINHFKNLGVDGLIIASFSLKYKATKYIRDLHEQQLPYVMISYMHEPEYWFVGSNHEYGAYLATNHLAQLGYKKIGYIHGGVKNILGEVRRTGYERAMADHNLTIEKKHIFYLDALEYDMDRYESGVSIAKQFLKLKNRPRAMFVYSDSAALGFMTVLLDKGLSIPDDVAIVGYNDIQMAKYAAVPLTTVHQPVDEIGRAAVSVLNKRINKLNGNIRTLFDPYLVVRKSCGAKM